MKTIKAAVTRAGEWLVADFSVDGKKCGTQGRTFAELELMVKDAAGLMTGERGEEFTIVFENDS